MSLARPTAAIFEPSINIAASSIGGPPKPSINLLARRSVKPVLCADMESS